MDKVDTGNGDQNGFVSKETYKLNFQQQMTKNYDTEDSDVDFRVNNKKLKGNSSYMEVKD